MSDIHTSDSASFASSRKNSKERDSTSTRSRRSTVRAGGKYHLPRPPVADLAQQFVDSATHRFGEGGHVRARNHTRTPPASRCRAPRAWQASVICTYIVL